MPTYRKLLEIISNMSAEQLDQPFIVRVDGEDWLTSMPIRMEAGMPIISVDTFEDSE